MWRYDLRSAVSLFLIKKVKTSEDLQIYDQTTSPSTEN